MTAKEFMFGYASPLTTLGNKFMPDWIYFEKVGLIDRMYDFDGDFETIYTGETDSSISGLIDTYKGSKNLKQCKDPHCSKINMASGGTKFKSFIEPNDTLLFFRKSMCRAQTLYRVDDEEKTIGSLTAYKYMFGESAMDNGHFDERNKCFCRDGTCLPYGLLDVSDCYYGFPIALNYPHFMHCDESVADNVIGTRPNRSLHETYFMIQPKSGLPLSLSVKMQINMAMRDISNIAHVERFSNLVVPTLWFEISEPNSGINSIKAFKTILTVSARDVYYRDDIGNISTSNMYTKHDSVEVTLRPRFPLFGGWKTRYVLGYNAPSYEYLFNEGSEYTLKMRLLDHVFDTMVVDHLITKIILPEGASNIRLHTPYEVKELPRSLHFTYLDVIGRPVVTVEGRNLVENHIQDVTIDYNFPKVYMLREPLLIVAGFLILFFTVLIYERLNFSISSSNEGTKGATSSAHTAVVESVLKRQAKRAQVYENFESQFQRLKSNKDPNAFQSALKALTAEHKVETQAINELITKHKADAPELTESITELQRLDRGFWEVYISYGQSLEKHISGKMSRTLYIEQDSQFNKKRDELAEKLNVSVKNL